MQPSPHASVIAGARMQNARAEPLHGMVQDMEMAHQAQLQGLE